MQQYKMLVFLQYVFLYTSCIITKQFDIEKRSKNTINLNKNFLKEMANHLGKCFNLLINFY